MREMVRPELSELRQRLSAEAVVRWHEPLARRTTLRVGGNADVYVEPASENDLALALEFAQARRLPVFVLGRGSNLLIRDGGIRGVVICLAHPCFSEVVVEGQRIQCGAGAKLKTVAVEARRAGLGGLEFLEGIPGSVGGALRMNAGAMGAWIFEVVDRVRLMDPNGAIEDVPAAALPTEYRACPRLRSHIALAAVLRGNPEATGAIEARAQAYNQRRWSTQPAAPSAGCIFRNPPSIPAGRLIEELGLKGRRVGGAVISTLHGNFILNEGEASARDVLSLIDLVRETARTVRGIELETEVEIVGEAG
jgi:UDP-N-acetylenolpyruvoylglucosamine reductase